MKFEVESSGTHGYHVGENADSRMRRTASTHGFPFDHYARHFKPSDIDYYDYIFVMDRGHYRDIQYLVPGNPGDKLRMFREFDPQGSKNEDVPDPYYGGQEGFELVLTIVDRTVHAILEEFRQGRL